MPRTAFLYSDEFLSYDLGSRHPLQQKRLQMVHQLLGSYGVFAPDGPIAWITPQAAGDEELALVHTNDYLNAVRRASQGQRGSFLSEYGLGPGDTPAFAGMYESAALYSGGSIEAARLVLTGDCEIAFNVAGGLHHAWPHRASGFCTFNDLALAIQTLRAGGCARVVYVDIDVHHGDGVEGCFWNDPNVLTISLHESGRYLFPGTGFAEDIGGPGAEGAAINLPFLPYTGDAVWHDAFDRVVPEVIERFAPDALVLQLGADAHCADPLAHLQLTAAGWMRAVDKLLTIGHHLPIVVTGGGGYNIKTVARLWTQVAACCAGIELPDRVPAAYAAKYDVHTLSDQEMPRLPDNVEEQTRLFARQQVETLRALHNLS